MESDLLVLIESLVDIDVLNESDLLSLVESLNDVDKLVELDKLVLVDILSDVETLSLLNVDVDSLILVDVAERTHYRFFNQLNDVDVLPDSDVLSDNDVLYLSNYSLTLMLIQTYFHLMIHLKRQMHFVILNR